jgi:hypothetical protein
LTSMVGLFTDDTEQESKAWLTLRRLCQEVEAAGNPGWRISKLVPAAYHLHKFLDGNFTEDALYRLAWRDAPRLVQEFSSIAFDPADSLCLLVWPKLIETLVSLVADYNSLCRSFFERILLIRDENPGPAAPLGTDTSAETTMRLEHFIIPPTAVWDLKVPLDPLSGALTITQWTPILQLHALQHAALLTKGAVAPTADGLDGAWQSYDIQSMIVRSVCRDVALGIKKLTVVVSPEPNIFRLLPTPTFRNLVSLSAAEEVVPVVLRAPVDEVATRQLLIQSEVRIELRRHGASLLRVVVDRLAGLPNTEVAEYVGRPLASLAGLLDQNGLNAVLIQIPDNIKIKNISDLIRSVFAAEAEPRREGD